jgi:RimJ/RimL family protein N-acetyltransferase
MSSSGETLPSIMSILEMTCLENEKQYVSAVHPEGPETVTLRDGTTVTVRPIRPDDASRLQALFTRLSPESIFFRFLGHRKELPYVEAEAQANVDYRTRMALVATREQCREENVIAVTRYEVIGPGVHDVAEAAIVVEDRFQGQGLGTLLLKRLVAYARTHGIRAFQAAVYHNNAQIIRFIQCSGLPFERKRIESGVWEFRVKLEAEPAH